MQIPCPSCGGGVDFKSRASVFQVCPYCSSMLVRTDLDIKTIGKMAQLPPDMSPFQVGTMGKFQKKHFEILGRQKLVYQDGNWNEWYVMFEDGKAGWLGEAQGFLMMSFQVENADVPKFELIMPGRQFQILNKPFEVEDIKSVTCAGGLGELPVKGVQGRKSVSVDLVGEGSTFASIDYSDEGNRLFLGQYAEFEDFNFTNLREIDGW